jgi:hypothetical protein
MSPLLRNVALTFLVTLAMYEGFLRVAAPQVDQGQDQFATNTIRLENYVDHPEMRGTVLVGSSLSARIPDAALPRGWTNLSLAGGSALTGLEIVANAARAPKVVLVEINFLDRTSDRKAVSRATGWPDTTLRRLFWFYRTAYRPMNLLVSSVARWVKAHRARAKVETAPPDFQGLLSQQKRDFASLPAKAALDIGVSRLRRLVHVLEAKGTKVAFYEMPTDASLMETPRERAMRIAVRSAMGPPQYCWLVLDRGEAWKTGDGLHLLYQDAVRAARRMARSRCVAH